MSNVASAYEDAANEAILVHTTTWYLSLHTAAPGGTGASEGTDGRQALTMAASSGGTQTSSSSETWSSAVGGQTYTAFGAWSLTSAGVYHRGGALNASITPPAGAEISVAAAGISFTAS